MAVETCSAKRQCMGCHEPQVHLTMAVVAGCRDECGDIALMAIVALERFPSSRLLVTV